MTSSLFFLLFSLVLVATACVSARVVEHTFQVQNLVVKRLCKEQEIIAVNKKYPGPTIYVHEGDTVVIHVFNKSPYDMAIHWHGVQMLFNCWADGADYVTQCPILSGDSYTYRFNITKQEGTLWWHAHVPWLRATIYGALIIYPKVGQPYPFEKPYKEIPILLGEWWNSKMMDVAYQYLHEDMIVAFPDALTINGQPGDFFQCSSKDTYKLKVKSGKTYLLRIIHAGLNFEYFYKIANHKMTVVSIDATYTIPYTTDVVYISPGQSVDVILKADQPPASYYMASRPYISWAGTLVLNMTTTGVLTYEDTNLPSSESPSFPELPDFYDTSTAHNFSTSLNGLTSAPFWVPVPRKVDEHMFITVGMGVLPCRGEYGVCTGPDGGMIYGNMNNVSFELPSNISILEAFNKNIDGVYTTDFPNHPPFMFDFAKSENRLNTNLYWIRESGTKVKRLSYNTTVQIVFQNTALVSGENHPLHLHGYNFHVLAQGFGNYDPAREERNFNLINPQMRNTISIPGKGWAVIRFQANNPGAWMMHCHFEYHQTVGLATAFIVDNGPSQSTSLPPPPLDFPKCNSGLSSTTNHQLVRQPVGKPPVLNSLE